METVDFDKIAKHVLNKNTYFSKGFANAVRDETTKKIISGDKKLILFPEDKHGSYFYLRNETSISFAQRQAERMSDCGVAQAPYEDSITCQMVALVNNADPFALLNNLRKSLATYKGATITFTSAIWSTQQIIREEMSGANETDIQEAQKRVKNITIVRLTCTVSLPFYVDSCTITNPCKPCNATA